MNGRDKVQLLKLAEEKYYKKDLPPFGPGDTVSVFLKIKESGKERVQAFRGVVIARRGTGLGESFIVRKVSFGVGVERVIPLHSPTIESIQVESRGDVRRAKLFFLRKLRGRKSRLKTYEEFIVPAKVDSVEVAGEASDLATASPEVAKKEEKADKPSKK